MKKVNTDVNKLNLDLLSKSKTSNSMYEKAGRVSLALGSINTRAAMERRVELGKLEEACRLTDKALGDTDLFIEATRQKKMAKYVEIATDGVVAYLAMCEPDVAKEIPGKTGYEYLDPVSYATKTIGVARTGSEVACAMAVGLERVLATYEAGQKAKANAGTERETALKNQALAKHTFEAYMSDCQKFIAQVAPKGHVAHKHLKKERAKPASDSPDAPKKESSKQEPPPAQPTPTAPVSNSPAAPADPPRPAIIRDQLVVADR